MYYEFTIICIESAGVGYIDFLDRWEKNGPLLPNSLVLVERTLGSVHVKGTVWHDMPEYICGIGVLRVSAHRWSNLVFTVLKQGHHQGMRMKRRYMGRLGRCNRLHLRRALSNIHTTSLHWITFIAHCLSAFCK